MCLYALMRNKKLLQPEDPDWVQQSRIPTVLGENKTPPKKLT